MKTNIIFIFLFVNLVSFAQGNRNMPTFDQMTERKWQEISDKAKLSDDEKKAVYPVFFEYEKSLFAINKILWDKFRDVRQNKSNSENINFSEINDLYVNTEIKQAELLKNYHEKLQKLITPETLFNYYLAERNFKKNLMQNIPHNPNKTKK